MLLKTGFEERCKDIKLSERGPDFGMEAVYHSAKIGRGAGRRYCVLLRRGTILSLQYAGAASDALFAMDGREWPRLDARSRDSLERSKLFMDQAGNARHTGYEFSRGALRESGASQFLHLALQPRQ